MTAALDAIVAFQDPKRLDQLSRSVFALAMQDHRPITIIVACPRFRPAERQAVQDTLDPLMTIAADAGLLILNHPAPARTNPRAALLNLGLSAARARYVAFLTEDDLVYPEAYRLLIAELVATGAAIAFGGLLEASVSREGLVPLTTAKRPVSLQDNPGPQHGFVLDRQRIAPAHLTLDETLPGQAEQPLLLRLCADYPTSIRLQEKIIAERTRDHSGKKSGTDKYRSPVS